MKTKILTTSLLIAAIFVWNINVQAQKEEKNSKQEKEVKIEKHVVINDDSEEVEHYEVIEHDDSDDDMWGGRFGGPNHANIPNLTEDQKNQLDMLRVEHQKKARLMHANLQEKRARLNTLRLADNPDSQELNKTIDEMAGLHADLMKEREAHRMAVRSKLNDKQKSWFDSRPDRDRRYGQKPQGYGMGSCHGPRWSAGKCCR